MNDNPPLLIYAQTCAHLLLDPRPGPRHALRAVPRLQKGTTMQPDDDQAAATAGEQDHSDPWTYAGEDADAPTDPDASA